MKSQNIAFSYKNGNSLIHKIPAVIKILLIPAFNIIIFNLPFYYSLILLILQFILCCILHFSIKEQFSDFKPVIYYAVLLYITSFIANFCSIFFSTSKEFLITIKQTAILVFKNTETLIMLLKLFCVIQSASIVFRTTSSLRIREGIQKIELFLRKILHLKKKTTVTNIITLFMSFIPLVFRNWNQCKKAWIARQGKNSVRMYLTIFPVFFSVSIKQAWNASRALLVRGE